MYPIEALVLNDRSYLYGPPTVVRRFIERWIFSCQLVPAERRSWVPDPRNGLHSAIASISCDLIRFPRTRPTPTANAHASNRGEAGSGIGVARPKGSY
jgi:hypothetical protein